MLNQQGKIDPHRIKVIDQFVVVLFIIQHSTLTFMQNPGNHTSITPALVMPFLLCFYHILLLWILKQFTGILPIKIYCQYWPRYQSILTVENIHIVINLFDKLVDSATENAVLTLTKKVIKQTSLEISIHQFYFLLHTYQQQASIN